MRNANGKLNVSWSFESTDLTILVVTCRSEEEGGSGLTTICAGYNNACGNGTTVIPTGPENVTSGMNYSCTVNATNTKKLNSVQHQETNYILVTSGYK